MVTDETRTLAAAELYIYPLKSGRAFPVPVLEFDERGPIGDRRWMLIDDQAEFLSQRRLPRMSLLRVSLQSDSLVVDAPGMSTLVVPPTPDNGASERLVAGLHEDRVPVVESARMRIDGSRSSCGSRARWSPCPGTHGALWIRRTHRCPALSASRMPFQCCSLAPH